MVDEKDRVTLDFTQPWKPTSVSFDHAAHSAFMTKARLQQMELDAEKTRAHFTNDKLRELTGEPPGWRPIATAPKDGTRILLWIGYALVGSFFDCNCAGEELWEDHDGMALDRERQTPTHWMPLPAPPAKENDDG